MYKKNFLFVLLIFLSFSNLYSEQKKSILSFDTGYLSKAIKNNGWGLGVTYEHEIFKGIAVKGGFSHMTMFFKDIDITMTTVGISADILYYPFNRGLDWLYFGEKSSTDFLMYVGDSITEKNNRDIIVSVMPLIGWKHTFVDMVMVDAFVGYNFVINPGEQTELVTNHIKNSFEYGIKVKFNLKNIINYFKSLSKN